MLLKYRHGERIERARTYINLGSWYQKMYTGCSFLLIIVLWRLPTFYYDISVSGRIDGIINYVHEYSQGQMRAPTYVAIWKKR